MMAHLREQGSLGLFICWQSLVCVQSPVVRWAYSLNRNMIISPPKNNFMELQETRPWLSFVLDYNDPILN